MKYEKPTIKGWLVLEGSLQEIRRGSGRYQLPIGDGAILTD